MAPPDPSRYRERLWPGPGLWTVTVIFAASVGLAVVPASLPVALVSAGAVLAVGVLLGVLTTPVVAVEGGELLAGRARIPLAMLGEVEQLDATTTRAALGPDLDARAYVCLRGWIHSAIKVPVTDPRDPAPYWFVSTRRPAALAGAIDAARTTTPPPAPGDGAVEPS